SAQSLDPSAPAPIRSNNLLGHISARDLGDSRLTNHYYSFTGTPGDLLITVQSRNLNGDLDVFTAGSLRPLLKLALYAESTTPISKSIYLRRREDLILRIEARSPNDDEGTYQLSFRGTFEPIVGGPEIAGTETSVTEPRPLVSNRGTKRVSSVGARLPEPEPPVTEVATAPSTTPEPTNAVKPTETELPAPVPEKEEVTPKSTVSRTPPRSRRPAGRRTSPSTIPKPKETETETAVAKTPKATEEVGEASESPKPKPSTRTTTRRGATSPPATKPKPDTEPVAEPESGPRLVIETNNGTLINRSMSTIRRVMVENGQVIVVGKDGRVDRLRLIDVVRMSIAQ
ncbi:MAG TPA: hypothetical protein VGQ39_12350, partial [Pyrinomonadaceae bacterium]|nr:hypothetical protein [Pyrinomonadaceae bacterium]